MHEVFTMALSGIDWTAASCLPMLGGPIIAYTGLPRSGKSYEVTRTGVVGGVGQKIDIYAYIDGLQIDEIRKFAAKQFKIPLEEVGNIRQLTEAEVRSKDLFPVLVDGVADDSKSIVKAGGRTIIDEAKKFYGRDEVIPKEHHVFFREHGHICHPITGVNCDVILITQSIADLHRDVRAVIERTFRTKKLSAVGLSSRYKMEIFAGGTTSYKEFEDSMTNLKYDRRVFKLYKSASNSNPIQALLDKRMVVVKNPRFWGPVLLAVLAIGYCIYKLGEIYTRNTNLPKPAEVAASKPAAAPGKQVLPENLLAREAAAKNPQVKQVPAVDYRLAGFYSADGANYALIEYADDKGRCRVKYMTIGVGSVIDGPRSSVVVDGKNIATFNSSPCAAGQKQGVLK